MLHAVVGLVGLLLGRLLGELTGDAGKANTGAGTLLVDGVA